MRKLRVIAFNICLRNGDRLIDWALKNEDKKLFSLSWDIGDWLIRTAFKFEDPFDPDTKLKGWVVQHPK